MGLEARPYIGTWKLNGQQLVQHTPDALVYLNGDTSLPGCAKCSGKIDIQYMFHAFEGGARGVCVLMCRRGTCTLAQGNYRALVRVGTVQRLRRALFLRYELHRVLPPVFRYPSVNCVLRYSQTPRRSVKRGTNGEGRACARPSLD